MSTRFSDCEWSLSDFGLLNFGLRIECDESIYWMELIVEAGLMEEKRLVDLKNEAIEILSMVVASIKTARTRK